MQINKKSNKTPLIKLLNKTSQKIKKKSIISKNISVSQIIHFNWSIINNNILMYILII